MLHTGSCLLVKTRFSLRIVVSVCLAEGRSIEQQDDVASSRMHLWSEAFRLRVLVLSRDAPRGVEVLVRCSIRILRKPMPSVNVVSWLAMNIYQSTRLSSSWSNHNNLFVKEKWCKVSYYVNESLVNYSSNGTEQILTHHHKEHAVVKHFSVLPLRRPAFAGAVRGVSPPPLLTVFHLRKSNLDWCELRRYLLQRVTSSMH
ncbi:hypothetical protein YC2023_010550 [Brassica napus]